MRTSMVSSMRFIYKVTARKMNSFATVRCWPSLSQLQEDEEEASNQRILWEGPKHV